MQIISFIKRLTIWNTLPVRDATVEVSEKAELAEEAAEDEGEEAADEAAEEHQTPDVELDEERTRGAQGIVFV